MRPCFTPVLLLLFLAGFSQRASAQMVIYGSSPVFFYGNSIATMRPPAMYDPRIDPKLVQASRIAEQRAEPHTILRCWRYVKNALLEAGAVREYPTTAYAKEAGSELVQRYGFVRLPVRDPYSAPVGSVLVYGGRGAGHVELRTAHGFASDYRSAWRCKFPLIGVYAKLSS